MTTENRPLRVDIENLYRRLIVVVAGVAAAEIQTRRRKRREGLRRPVRAFMQAAATAGSVTAATATVADRSTSTTGGVPTEGLLADGVIGGVLERHLAATDADERMLRRTADALDGLEAFALNLHDSPWKPEIRQICTYSGFYKSIIEPSLGNDVCALLRLLGYDLDPGNGVWRLTSRRVSGDALVPIALDFYLAAERCRLAADQCRHIRSLVVEEDDDEKFEIIGGKDFDGLPRHAAAVPDVRRSPSRNLLRAIKQAGCALRDSVAGVNVAGARATRKQSTLGGPTGRGGRGSANEDDEPCVELQTIRAVRSSLPVGEAVGVTSTTGRSRVVGSEPPEPSDYLRAVLTRPPSTSSRHNADDLRKPAYVSPNSTSGQNVDAVPKSEPVTNVRVPIPEVAKTASGSCVDLAECRSPTQVVVDTADAADEDDHDLASRPISPDRRTRSTGPEVVYRPKPTDGLPTSGVFSSCPSGELVVDRRHRKPHVDIPTAAAAAPYRSDPDKLPVGGDRSKNLIEMLLSLEPERMNDTGYRKSVLTYIKGTTTS